MNNSKKDKQERPMKVGQKITGLLLIGFLTMIIFALPVSSAMAACSNPTGEEGEQIYNVDHKVMQYCDGTDWTAMRDGGATGSGSGSGVAAWINFDGRSGGTTRASDNLSVTRTAAGQYTFTFDTPMPDANYVINVTSSDNLSTARGVDPNIISQSTTEFEIHTSHTGLTATADAEFIHVSVIADGFGGSGGSGGSGSGGSGSAFIICTNENTDGDGTDDKAECIEAATLGNGSFVAGTADYFPLSCDLESGVVQARTGSFFQWNGSVWTGWNSGAYANCVDGTMTIANVNGGGGGSDTLAGLSCTDGQVAAWDDGGSEWICADGGSGGGETINYLLASLSSAQNNLAVGNTVVFNTVDDSLGTDISLNTSTGVFTLKAGKTYRLSAQLQVQGSSPSGAVDGIWRNVTDSVNIGQPSATSSRNQNTPWGNKPTAIAYVTATVDTDVAFRGHNFITSGIDVTATAWIEALSTSGGGGSDTLAGLSCTDGQIAAWDDGGSEWICADGGSGGASGSGSAVIDTIEAQGTTIDAVTIDATNNKWPDYLICDHITTGGDRVLRLQSYQSAIVQYGDQHTDLYYWFNKDGSYNSRLNMAANCGASAADIDTICSENRCGFGGGGSADTLAGLSCTDGQVAKWNNGLSQWECAADGGDDLGDHTATQNLNMSSNNITNAGTISAESPSATYAITALNENGGGAIRGIGDSDAAAIRGQNLGSGSNAHGIIGLTSSSTAAALYGISSSASGVNYGVHGTANSNDGYGGYFSNPGGVALKAAGVFEANTIDMLTGTIVNLQDPTNAQDAATKAYVDANSAGDDLGDHTATQNLNMSSNNIINVRSLSASSPTNTLLGVTSGTTSNGVWGVASAATGVNFGVRGRSDSSSGRGVYGWVTSTGGGTPYGVFGESASTAGAAVYGYATNTVGNTKGVFGHVVSPDGTGVWGINTSSTGSTAYGVRGITYSTNGRGVLATASAATGNAYAIEGVALSTSGRGVYGNVTASSGTTYGVYGTSASSAGFGGYFTNTGGGVALHAQGDATVSGNVTATAYLHSSDERLKDNIKPVSGLDLIMQLRGVTYDWKESGKPSAGIIAQDVEKVLPSAVQTNEDGMKSVEYDQLIAPLIEAVKELKAENDSLKQRIETLENAE
jgi:hypothetical protein